MQLHDDNNSSSYINDMQIEMKLLGKIAVVTDMQMRWSNLVHLFYEIDETGLCPLATCLKV